MSDSELPPEPPTDDGAAEPEPAPAEGESAEKPRHPIRLVVTDDLRRSRLTTFFRLPLMIPLWIWAGVWGLAVAIVLVLSWFVALVIGRIPSSFHRFMAAYLRFSTHFSAYLFLAANPYPGFTGQPGYPVDCVIAPPEKQRRLGVFFRLLLAIPALIVTNVLLYLAYVLAVIAWFIAMVTGRMNEGLRDLLAYVLRYQAQTNGYVWLLTRRYPSFSDDA